MNDIHYEVYVESEKGPATVHERDENNNYAWTEKQIAIDVADRKKKLYPHMDFIVHEVTGNSQREVVHRTSAATKISPAGNGEASPEHT